MAIAAQGTSFSHIGCSASLLHDSESDNDDERGRDFMIFEAVGMLFGGAEITLWCENQTEHGYSQTSQTENIIDKNEGFTFVCAEDCEAEEVTTRVASNSARISDDIHTEPEVENRVSAINRDENDGTSMVKSPDPSGTVENLVSLADETGVDAKDDGVSQSVILNKRKRLSRKERFQKKERKGRQIDPQEFGFHFSVRQRLVVSIPSIDDDLNESDKKDKEPTSISDNDTHSKSSTSDSAELSTESVPDNTELCTESASDNVDSADSINISEQDCTTSRNSSSNDDDDVSFFAELGIDVNDCGIYNDEDDYLEWDGLRVSGRNSNQVPALSSDKHTSTKSRDMKNRSKSSKHEKSTKAVVAKSTSTSLKESEINTKHKVTTVVDTYEFSLPNYKMTTQERIQFLELECNGSRRIYFRKDRNRRIEKVHKAVKSPHCLLENIMNNKGKKMMYMHHRLIKKANLCLDFRYRGRLKSIPMPKDGVDLQVAKAIRLKPQHERPPRPAQNLRHVLHETNVPGSLEMDLASFLLSIQNRELTPEDYEMLLRLDDNVKAKTVSKNVLKDLKTETVGPDIANILTCVICMEPYLEGQIIKFLPCEHDFHSDCVDSWLANSSQNCPLDGLPIVNS